MIHREAQIHKAVVQHLKLRGVPGLLFWHTPNSSKLGGKRTKNRIPIEALINKGLGVRAGVSDLLLLHQGTLYALELKAPGGRPTASQLAFIADVQKAGGHGVVAEDLDRALYCLEHW